MFPKGMASVIAILCAFSVSLTVEAKVKKALPDFTEKPNLESFKGVSGEEYQALLKTAEKYQARDIAQVVSEESLSEEFKSEDKVKPGLRRKLWNVKTKFDLDTLINSLEKETYKPESSDARLLRAQLLLLKPYRGIYHRIRFMFEKNNQINAKMMHSAVVAFARQLATAVQVFMQNDQWVAGFKYISEPVDSKDAPINNEHELKVWLYGELRPALENYMKAISEIDSSKSFYWDNRVTFGEASFGKGSDLRDHFRKVGFPEMEAMKSATCYTISAIDSVLAYKLTGLIDITAESQKLYGFDAVNVKFNVMGDHELHGAPAVDRHQIVRNHLHEFLVKEPGYQAWMFSSLVWLREGIAHGQASYLSLKGKKVKDDGAWWNPAVFVALDRMFDAGWSDLAKLAMLDKSLTPETLKQVKTNPVPLTSLVTHRTVTFDLIKYFQEPPERLTDFMPIANGYALNEKKELPFLDADQKPILVAGKTATYRNYLWGSATTWNLNAFEKYFPGISKLKGDPNKSEALENTAIPRAARILSQSWAGWIAGVPLTQVIQ